MAALLKDKRTPITTPPYQVISVDVTPDPPIFSLVTTFNVYYKTVNFSFGNTVVVSGFVDPHWFSTDPDLAFYLNADPDPGSQTNVDPIPDPGQTLKSQKVKFYMKNKLIVQCGMVGIRSKRFVG
jgi:hypothetical protein